jgi:leucyl aminopeptidase
MKINFVKAVDFSALKSGAAVLVLTQEQTKKSNLKPVKFAKENFEFSGKNNQAHLVNQDEKLVLVIGVGEEKKIDEKILQKLGGRIFNSLNAAKISEATIFFDDKNAAQIAFGALLGSYRFNKYFEDKKKSKETKLAQLNFAVADVSKAQKEFAELKILADNIFLVRDLVSEPSNILHPESYADICKAFKKDGLEIEILGEVEMKKLGMGSLLTSRNGQYLFISSQR